MSKNTLIDRILRQTPEAPSSVELVSKEIIEALKSIRATGHGALIFLAGNHPLTEIEASGDSLDAKMSSRLIFTIFQKESPLHDGAMMVRGDRIVAVRCILPISKSLGISPELGLRHRAGVGLAEISDALVIIASEERREVSLAYQGNLRRKVDYLEIEEAIQLHYQRSLL
ncbi:MAG: DNA integrity scanning protein DisA nucleotide-binding domain protein [Bacteroidota bacterium]